MEPRLPAQPAVYVPENCVGQERIILTDCGFMAHADTGRRDQYRAAWRCGAGRNPEAVVQDIAALATIADDHAGEPLPCLDLDHLQKVYTTPASESQSCREHDRLETTVRLLCGRFPAGRNVVHAS